MARDVRLIECPRDAMQGLPRFIPTAEKIRYNEALLKCGFDTLDCGSFVNPQAVPQMKDTAEMLQGLDLSNSVSKLLVIVANLKGAKQACEQEKVTYVGYPLSASETFQQKNTKRDIATALSDLKDIKAVCDAAGKVLVVYISMGFGNPYGEPYSTDNVIDLVQKVVELGATVVSLADTVGVAQPATIQQLFSTLIPRYKDKNVEVGAHFHLGPMRSVELLNHALDAGCRRFDGTVGGMGGCPFAKSSLTGNISSQALLQVLQSRGIEHGVDLQAYAEAEAIKHDIFGVGIKEMVLAETMTDERKFMELCIEHFKKADTNERGYLQFPEFHTSLTSAYHELGEKAPSEEVIQQKFREIDLSKDGRITLEEYIICVRRGLRKRMPKIQAIEEGA